MNVGNSILDVTVGSVSSNRHRRLLIMVRRNNNEIDFTEGRSFCQRNFSITGPYYMLKQIANQLEARGFIRRLSLRRMVTYECE